MTLITSAVDKLIAALGFTKQEEPRWGYLTCRQCGYRMNALVLSQDQICPVCRRKNREGA